VVVLIRQSIKNEKNWKLLSAILDLPKEEYSRSLSVLETGLDVAGRIFFSVINQSRYISPVNHLMFGF